MQKITTSASILLKSQQDEDQSRPLRQQYAYKFREQIEIRLVLVDSTLCHLVDEVGVEENATPV